jgi:putative FmdB family regulatory protein
MPIYEWVCSDLDCQLKFERFGKLEEKPPKCPRCKSKTEQVFSVPAKRDPNYGIQR